MSARKPTHSSWLRRRRKSMVSSTSAASTRTQFPKSDFSEDFLLGPYVRIELRDEGEKGRLAWDTLLSCGSLLPLRIHFSLVPLRQYC